MGARTDLDRPGDRGRRVVSFSGHGALRSTGLFAGRWFPVAVGRGSALSRPTTSGSAVADAGIGGHLCVAVGGDLLSGLHAWRSGVCPLL